MHPCTSCLALTAPLPRRDTDLIVDVALEAHRAARLGVESGGEEGAAVAGVAGAEAEAASEGRNGADVFGARHPPVPVDEFPCPNCARAVQAGRFAPHLEKCMGKGRAAARQALKREGPQPGRWSPPKAKPKKFKEKPAQAVAVPPQQQPAALAARPLQLAPGGAPLPRITVVPPRAPGGLTCGAAAAAGFAPGRWAPPAGAAAPPPRAADVHTWHPAPSAPPPPSPWAPLPMPPPPPPPPLRVRLPAPTPAVPLPRAPAPPAPRRPPGGAPPGGGKSLDGRRRKELRGMLASAVSLEDMSAYAAAPPSEPGSLPERAIYFAAKGLREMEPGGAAGDGDVALVLRHMCAVVSQRSGTQGRLCSNGLACSNHRDEQRAAVRAAILGGAGAAAWAETQAVMDASLIGALPQPLSQQPMFALGGGVAPPAGGASDDDDTLLLPSHAGGGAALIW